MLKNIIQKTNKQIFSFLLLSLSVYYVVYKRNPKCENLWNCFVLHQFTQSLLILNDLRGDINGEILMLITSFYIIRSVLWRNIGTTYSPTFSTNIKMGSLLIPISSAIDFSNLDTFTIIAWILSAVTLSPQVI